MDLRMRSLAIHSTIDFALISLSCSSGTSYSDVSAILRITKKDKTHVFNTLHIIDISPLVILPPCTRACTREQSRLGIVSHTRVIAVKEVWRVAAVGRAHATAASTLHAVSLAHLGFGCTASGGRQRLELLGIIQA